MIERFKSLTEKEIDLPRLRNRFVDYLSYIFVFILPLSFVLNFPFFIRQKNYIPIIVEIVLWIILLIRVFIPSLGYLIRTIIWLVMLYALAISFLITMGPDYARPAWLIFCVVSSAILFGTRAVLVTTACNVVILMLLYMTCADTNAAWASARQDGLTNWLFYLFNVTLATLCISLPIGYLIKHLNASLQSERHTKDEQTATMEELEAAMEELQATNEEFEAQNEELVRSEQELSAKETFIRRIVENAPAVIFRYSIKSRSIEYASPGSVELTGYSLEETATDRNLFKSLIPEEWRATLRSYWLEMQKGNLDGPIRYPIIHKSGDTRWVEQRNVILRDQEGAIIGMEGFCTDITMQVEMEEALRLSEEKYRSLVENINEVIFSLDSAGNFIYISHAITRLTGYTPAELAGKNYLSFIHKDDIPGITTRFNELMKNIRLPLEYRIITKTGGVRWVISFSSPIMADGKVQGITGIITDIHERKEAEAERERVQNQLVQAQKMEAVGTLAGGLAHDFNNMLGGIMGSLDLIGLLLKQEDIRQRDELMNYLETALDASRRAADLTRRILTLSRKKELHLAPVDVNKSLANVMNICAGSFPKSVKLDFHMSETELRINADQTQVEQVLINLCLNASQAMTIMRQEGDRQGGTLLVVAKPFRSGKDFCASHPEARQDTDYAMVQVCDTGIGMDQETRKRIFEPFFTTKQKESGTGLGLAMAYGIIRQHQGFIDVYSEAGIGSTFTVYIPQMGEGMTEQPDDKGESIVPGAGLILVVDDEETILRVASGMLGQFGYDVLTARNAAEGIDIYRREHRRIDAVILDLSMPGMSGLEAYERMKQVNPGIRALLTSGFMEDELLASSREKGIRSFVQKPYSAEELSRKVKEVLD